MTGEGNEYPGLLFWGRCRTRLLLDNLSSHPLKQSCKVALQLPFLSRGTAGQRDEVACPEVPELPFEPETHPVPFLERSWARSRTGQSARRLRTAGAGRGEGEGKAPSQGMSSHHDHDPLADPTDPPPSAPGPARAPPAAGVKLGALGS